MQRPIGRPTPVCRPNSCVFLGRQYALLRLFRPAAYQIATLSSVFYGDLCRPGTPVRILATPKVEKSRLDVNHSLTPVPMLELACC